MEHSLSTIEFKNTNSSSILDFFFEVFVVLIFQHLSKRAASCQMLLLVSSVPNFTRLFSRIRLQAKGRQVFKTLL